MTLVPRLLRKKVKYFYIVTILVNCCQCIIVIEEMLGPEETKDSSKTGTQGNNFVSGLFAFIK
jgi:hypothetical protein